MKTSDEMLGWLSCIGAPRLMRHDDGTWSAVLKMAAPEGVQLEVRSDFNHSSHISALVQLVARVDQVPGVADIVRKTGPLIESGLQK